MQPRSPDAFRCCAQQYIASDSARLARDRFDCELKPSDNDNRRRCCYSGRRHRIIAPKNRAISRNHISRSLIVPALQPAQPAQISLAAEEMEARWDLEPPLCAAVSRLLAPPEFRWVLAKPFCAATAIFQRRFSFFSFLFATLLRWRPLRFRLWRGLWRFARSRRSFGFFRRRFPCFRLWFRRRRRRRRFLSLVRRSFWLRCRARRFLRRW